MSVGEDGWRGAGNRFGVVSQLNPGGGVAGVSWHCGGGHMEGRLALWLPPERAPADNGDSLPRGREGAGGGRERERERGGRGGGGERVQRERYYVETGLYTVY